MKFNKNLLTYIYHSDIIDVDTIDSLTLTVFTFLIYVEQQLRDIHDTVCNEFDILFVPCTLSNRHRFLFFNNGTGYLEICVPKKFEDLNYKDGTLCVNEYIKQKLSEVYSYE